MRKISILIIFIITTLLVGSGFQVKRPPLKATATPTRTRTITPTSTITRTPTQTLPPTEAFVPTDTLVPSEALTPTITVEPTNTPASVLPYPDAPPCVSHNTSEFHTLWDYEVGCHHDHEHGQSPFTSEVQNAFPDMDLYALLGNVQVGHTNPSSPMENTHKHGGFKWNVQLFHPQGCQGFEGAITGVKGSVIQYHGFGDYEVEASSRLHSTVALLRQCRTPNPADYGYVFINQLQDYGQRIAPYQGDILPYENQPVPAYPSPRGPYLSIGCIFGDLTRCRSSLEEAQNNRASTVWTSKVTGEGHSDTPNLFRLLWRGENIPRLIDIPNFRFVWICSLDGLTYNPEGCRYNNTTTQVHEISGNIPSSWDNRPGWDTNMTVGRVTAEGYVDGNGNINSACSEAGAECYPIRLINAFTGNYGSVLVFTDGKGVNLVPINPDRNIFFDGVPSGWVGANN